MLMQVGRGLKAVAKREFEQKVQNLASVPSSGVRTHEVRNGKVGTVAVGVIIDAAMDSGLTHLLTSDRLVIAKRR